MYFCWRVVILEIIVKSYEEVGFRFLKGENDIVNVDVVVVFDLIVYVVGVGVEFFEGLFIEEYVVLDEDLEICEVILKDDVEWVGESK